jgi:CHASE3 domain sensor protein
MTIEEMRQIDAIKTYKELEAAKVEIQRLTAKIQELYEGAEEQRRTIREIEELNEYLRQKNDKLEYGRTSK